MTNTFILATKTPCPAPSHVLHPKVNIGSLALNGVFAVM